MLKRLALAALLCVAANAHAVVLAFGENAGGFQWAFSEQLTGSCAGLLVNEPCSIAELTRVDAGPFVLRGFDYRTTNSDWCLSPGGPHSTIFLGGGGSGPGGSFSFGREVNNCSFLRSEDFSDIVVDTVVFEWRRDFDFIAIQNIEVLAVPEPSTYALFGFGLLLLTWLQRAHRPSGSRT